MSSSIPSGAETPQAKQPAGWFRFSVRSMLVLILVAAAFFAGRSGDRLFQTRSVAGTYSILFTSGSERESEITHMGNDEFQLRGCGVLDGVYRLKDNHLLILRPVDQRMQGLRWRRNEASWTLVGEPADTPTGSSYVGATLRPIADSE